MPFIKQTILIAVFENEFIILPAQRETEFRTLQNGTISD